MPFTPELFSGPVLARFLRQPHRSCSSDGSRAPMSIASADGDRTRGPSARPGAELVGTATVAEALAGPDVGRLTDAIVSSTLNDLWVRPPAALRVCIVARPAMGSRLPLSSPAASEQESLTVADRAETRPVVRDSSLARRRLAGP